MLSSADERKLKLFAEEIRRETLKSILHYGMGHLGGAASMTEALAVLYGKVMRYDVNNPRWDQRDRFVLSKGHAGPGLYATLALSGFFPMEELDTMNQSGSILPSHCDMNKTPGVDMSSGSLGLGLSVALGMALGAKLTGADFYTYAMVGDGECDEGQIWEAVLMAAHQKAGRLIAFFDKNGSQLDGPTEEVCQLGDLAAKLADFGWHVQEVDGHNVAAIYDAILAAKAETEKPSAIILDTVKGYGFPNALNMASCHCIRYSTPELRNEGAEDLQTVEARIRGLKEVDAS